MAHVAGKGDGQTDEQGDEAGHDRAGSKGTGSLLGASSEHDTDDGTRKGGERAQHHGTG